MIELPNKLDGIYPVILAKDDNDIWGVVDRVSPESNTVFLDLENRLTQNN
ncbi:hypothetical protein BXY85_0049 [Roseivirga pacifica]|uniref:Uncharacterized protein n=1 Tax=Roseivirga pacifica TaxID=1267423 RepID=A0A1I0R5H5_9BACT|nr:hypothetical protein BXY85_0049 [Roseivirga pacifica]SEW35787.1 hypothetical protein SAMN05216290_3102 [Roseivirga pacifica]